MKWWSQRLLIVAILLWPMAAWASYSKSTNYSVDETLLGGNGLNNSASTNFSARSASGAIAVGDTSSTNDKINSGNVNDADPALTLIITGASGSFSPAFSTAAVSHATATFSVKNYTSYGYVVNLYGTSVQSPAGYTIPAMASNDISRPGTEQFGVNLVANTGFGSNPVQVPSSSFSFGVASTNYNTANSFRFVSGDQIASAPKSSGETDYTISYIVNVKGTTPGGSYSASQFVICTGTY